MKVIAVAVPYFDVVVSWTDSASRRVALLVTAILVLLALPYGSPGTARADDGVASFTFADRGMTCEIGDGKALCVAAKPAFGVDGDQPCKTPNVSARVFDYGEPSAFYSCGDLKPGKVLAPGAKIVSVPFVCDVIGSGPEDEGFRCVNIHYGSGFTLQRNAYNELPPMVPSGLDSCREGYVWRNAAGDYPLDHVCVTPEVQAATVQENADAPGNTQPNGTCNHGLVWRAAYYLDARERGVYDDRVCVTPEAHDQAASDNSREYLRRVPW